MDSGATDEPADGTDHESARGSSAENHSSAARRSKCKRPIHRRDRFGYAQSQERATGNPGRRGLSTSLGRSPRHPRSTASLGGPANNGSTAYSGGPRPDGLTTRAGVDRRPLQAGPQGAPGRQSL